MIPDKIEHFIVFMNYWDVSLVSFGASQSVISKSHIYPLTPLVLQTVHVIDIDRHL